jgi:tRNA modification GTPase
MIHTPDEQTIIAQCTPRGSGAIALLRISGANAIAIADAIAQLPGHKKLAAQSSHTIHYGSIINHDGSIVDTGMFLLMQAPKTFTGQDTIEITCHNNQFIVEQIITLAIAAGARLAQEGEFTKRAVLNNKIDLIQAEAINELIHAQTQQALKQSLAQLKGSFSQWIETLEKDLLKALALSEASFEFLDEEMEFAPQIIALITHIQKNIAHIKITFNQQQQIRQGIRIALIGSVNAGKSSLFNALLKHDRAIVTPIAGTTRDSIEAGITRNGNNWTLVDTAGLRQTDDVIEQAGIKRSLEEAHKADIILLVIDSTRSLTAEENAVYQQLHEQYADKIICVATKADIVLRDASDEAPQDERKGAFTSEHIEDWVEEQDEQSVVSPFALRSTARCVSKGGIPISSKTNHNIDLLEQLIEQKIASLFATIASPFLLNQRHYTLLLALEKKLHEIQAMLEQKSVAYELLSIHLNDAIASLAELSGKEISEAGMDMIFREFCIGK